MRKNETFWLLVNWRSERVGFRHYLGVPYESYPAVKAAWEEAWAEDLEQNGDEHGQWMWLSTAVDDDGHPAIPQIGDFQL